MALTQKQIEEEAYKVIRGEYGNGEERKKALGENYDAIQSKVNELSNKSGGASNVKAPSTSNSTATTSTAKTTTTKTTSSVPSPASLPKANDTNNKSSVADKSKIKTSSTANEMNNRYTTKEERNAARKNPIQDKTKYETTSTDVKTYGGENKQSGKVQTLQKNNDIQVVDSNGNLINTVSEERNLILDEDDYKKMEKAVDNLGDGSALYNNIEKFTPTKGLKAKYKASGEELYNAYIKQKEKKDKEWGEKHPFLSSISTIGRKAVQTPVSNAMNVATNLIAPDSQVTKDYNKTSRRYNNTITEQREGVKENIDSDAGKVVYDTGMGIADRIAANSIGKIASGGGLVLGAAMNGANLSGQYLQNAQDRGVNNRRAAAIGLANGGVDALLTAHGLEKIVNANTGKIAKDILKSGLIGFGEAEISYAVQEAADNVFAGKSSTYNTNKANYMAQGMTDEEATTEALKDEALGLLQQGATGFGFGAGMKGLGYAKNIPSLFRKSTDANVETTADSDLPRLKADESPVDEERIDTSVDGRLTDAEIRALQEGMDDVDGARYSGEDVNAANSNSTNEDMAALNRRLNNILNSEEVANSNEPNVDPRVVNKVPDSAVAQNEEIPIARQEITQPDVINENAEGVLPVKPEEITPTNVKTETPVNTDVPSPKPEEITPNNVNSPNNAAPSGTAGTSGDTNYSKVYTNTYENNNIAKMADLVDRRDATYNVHHNSETMADATNRVTTDGAKWESDYISGKAHITSDTDVDTAMLLLTAKRDLIDATTDPVEKTRLNASYRALKNQLRKAGTKFGQLIQAFAKWNGTSEGAITNAERMMDIEGQKWGKKNAKANAKVEDMANNISGERKAYEPREAGKQSTKLAKALSDMGNDSLKESNRQPSAPKSREQVRAEVIATLEREFGSTDQKFSDADIDVLTNFVQSIPTWQLTDELTHKLQHGDWYTIDESIAPKLEKNPKLKQALKLVTDDNVKNFGAKEPISDGRLREQIRNTINDEYGSLAKDLNSDADIEVLASFIEENVPNWVIADEIKHKLQHGQWYTLDESVVPYQKSNGIVNRALDMAINGEPEAKTPEALDINELRAQIRESIDREYADIAGDFTDDDVNYLATLVDSGVKGSDLADALRTKMATGSWGIPDETITKVNNLFDEAKRYDINSKQRVELETQAFWELANANKKNSSLADKFENWRYLAMLGNPKTHIRNIVGNTLFQGVTSMSNTMAAVMEEGVDSVAKKLNNGEGINRTKAVLTPNDSDLVKACSEDAINKTYRQLSGNKYLDNVRGEIERQREVFGTKAMNWLSAKNSDLLDKEDFSAMRTKYKTSMAGYLKSNGADASIFDAEHRYQVLNDAKSIRLLSQAEQIELSQLEGKIDLLNKARNYAVKQAEYSAFHEDNAVSNFLTETSRKARNSDNKFVKAGGLMLEGVIPFKKTPANILRSGIEYSPLNIINDAVKVAKMKKGTATASDLIESMSKTLTGTGLVALGSYLYDKGILLSSDEETKWQDSLEGIQNYALKIGGKTYTIDFAAPFVMPLLLGAEVKKVFDSNNVGSDESPESLTDRFLGGLENGLNVSSKLASPIMETSMLSGINDTLEALQKGNSLDAISTLAGTTLTGYATQGIPTVMGQFARAIDPTRRSTYTDKTGLSGVVDKQIQKQENKIPFLSKTNEPYVDAYGREQQNAPVDNLLGRFLYQSFSPSYVQDVNTTPVDAEERRLYDNSKDTKLFSDLDTQGTVKGEKLSKEDYTEYSKQKGTLDYEGTNAIISNPAYKTLSDADKSEMIESMHKFAKSVAQYEQGGSDLSNSDKELYDAYKSGGVKALEQKIFDKVDYQQYGKEHGLSAEDSGKIKKTQENIAKYVDSKFTTDAEKGKAFIEMYGNTLKKDANEAAEKGDYAKVWDMYKDKATGQSNAKTIPSPQSLANTYGANAIAKNGQKELQRQENIANQDISSYTTNRGKGTVSFSADEGIPALDSMYNTNAEKSKAILDQGVSTKGVNATRQTFGDDYVYDYYSYKKYADADGNGYIKKDELTNYLKSQGMSDDEIAKWWSVFKK